MLRIKFTYIDILNPNNPLNDLSPFYFADEALDYDNKYWEPRIADTFEIERFFNMDADTSNQIRTISVQLDNSDKWFNQFETKDTTLLNNLMTLYYDNGNNITKTFTGKIQSIDSFGTIVTLSIRELGYEYLENTFPDAQIAYDYYSENGINDNWNCIPIHFGTVNRIPVSWVNSFLSEYMIGSGPILSVNKVYIDDEVIYDKDAETPIQYKWSNDAKVIHVRIFRGRGYDADGQREYVDDEYHYENENPLGGTDLYRHVSNWGGFAYIQLFSVDDDGYEIPAYPYNKDGAIGQIYVDICGIVSCSIEPGGIVYGNSMIRNPAEIIKLMFCQKQLVSEGPCAIGWGYNSNNCNFNQAIIDCEDIGFKIDGSFDSSVQFGEALKQILYCCRGYIIEENEKITLKIDKAKDSDNPSCKFDEEGMYGEDCNIDNWNTDDLDNHINRVRLNYDWSQEFNKYNKKPETNHESPDVGSSILYDEVLKDENDTLKVQKWNTEEIELKLVSDCSTAHKLAIYYLRKKSRQHIKGTLTCKNSVASSLDAGDVISIRSKQFDWYYYDEDDEEYDTTKGKLFRITNITKGNDITTIEYTEYNPDIFEYDHYNFTKQNIDDSVDNKLAAKKPKNVIVTPSVYQASLINICKVDGTIVFDSSGYKLYSVVQYYDCGITPPNSYNNIPDASWTNTINVDGSTFTYDNLIPGHYYLYKVYTKNQYSQSEPYITTPILMVGNTIPPDVPLMTLTTYLKTITASIVLANPPDDISGFELFRSNNDIPEDYGNKVGECTCDETGFGVIIDSAVPQYNIPYYYSVRSFDTWGNKSQFSNKISASCGKVTEEDMAQAMLGAVPYAVITMEEIDSLFEEELS